MENFNPKEKEERPKTPESKPEGDPPDEMQAAARAYLKKYHEGDQPDKIQDSARAYLKKYRRDWYEGEKKDNSGHEQKQEKQQTETEKRNQEHIEAHHKKWTEDAKNKQEDISETKTQETQKSSETPKTKPEEKPEVKKEISDLVAKKAEFLGIVKEDLEKIEGFAGLSEGRQVFVIESLNKIAVEKAKTDAQLEYQDSLRKAGFLGRMFKGFGKEASIVNLEGKKFNEAIVGGVKMHGETLKELAAVINKGPEVEIKNGKIEIKYVSSEDFGKEGKLNISEEKSLSLFNYAAAVFSELSEEGAFRTANKKDRKVYNGTREKYNTAKVNLIEAMKKAGASEKDIFLALNKAENYIKLNQFLNNNGDVEKYAAKASLKSGIMRVLFNTVTDKVYSGAAGVGARHFTRIAAIGTFGAVGAPFGAAIFGGISSGLRARKELLNREKASRKGVEDKGKEAKNFVSTISLSEKFNRLLEEKEQVKNSEMQEAEKEAALKKLDARLAARIRYTQDKLDAGLVNFGQGTNAAVNRFNLIRSLSDAIVESDISKFSNGSNLEEVKSVSRTTTFDRFDEKGLVFRKGEITEEMKNSYRLMGVPFVELSDEQERGVRERKREERNKFSLEDRMRSFLDFRGEVISARQKDYILKRAIKGAAMSAGAALGGYMVRYCAGEWFGWGKRPGIFDQKELQVKDNMINGDDTVETTDMLIENGGAEKVTERGASQVVVGVEAVSEKGSVVKGFGVEATAEKGSVGTNIIEGVEALPEKEILPGEVLQLSKTDYVNEDLFTNLKAGESIKNRLEEMLGYNLTDENYVFKNGQHIIKDFQEKGFSLVLKTGENGEIKFGVNGPAALGRYNWGGGGKNWFFKPDAKFDQENLKKAIEFIKKANDSFYKGPSDYSGKGMSE